MTSRLLLIGTLVAAVATADEKGKDDKGKTKPKETAAQTLGNPDYLSELARQILRRRMARHGKDMTQMMSAVVLLKREVVETLASGIAAEPRITRPLPDSKDDLNAALPESFFIRQDELRDRARNLVEAARSKDDRQLGESFGRLTQTCIGCHSAFLNPRREDPK